MTDRPGLMPERTILRQNFVFFKSGFSVMPGCTGHRPAGYGRGNYLDLLGTGVETVSTCRVRARKLSRREVFNESGTCLAHVLVPHGYTHVPYAWLYTCPVRMAMHMSRTQGYTHVPYAWLYTCPVRMAVTCPVRMAMRMSRTTCPVPYGMAVHMSRPVRMAMRMSHTHGYTHCPWHMSMPHGYTRACDSMPQSSLPRLMRKYPFSPQNLFQLLATFQYFVPESTPISQYPTNLPMITNVLRITNMLR